MYLCHFVRLIQAALLLLAMFISPVSQAEPPKVTLSGLSLIEAGMAQQRFKVRLKLANPNSFPFEIVGLKYFIEVNGYLLADGKSLKPASIPAQGSGTLELDAVTDLLTLFAQLTGISPDDPLRFRLKGNLLYGPAELPIPFEQTGTLTLPSLHIDAR